METAGYRGDSRRQKPKGRRKKDKRAAHFQTVRFGGFEESQVICYLWDLVKAMTPGETGTGLMSGLERQLRKRIRVEMRRYFLRQKRRNVILAVRMLLAGGCAALLFGFLVGVVRVSGDSMFPYLNDGDWILYGRIGAEYQRDQVVVFDRDGESFVKRIAGLPGDTVEISVSGSRVVVNGTQLRETYVTLPGPNTEEDGNDHGDQMGAPLTVLDGQYLVLGDNRAVSIDSRSEAVGTVPKEDILGRVLLIVRAGR